MKRALQVRKKYPIIPNWRDMASQIKLYTQLKHEYGAKKVGPILVRIDRALKAALHQLETLTINRVLAEREPNNLEAIRRLCPNLTYSSTTKHTKVAKRNAMIQNLLQQKSGNVTTRHNVASSECASHSTAIVYCISCFT